MSRNLPHVQPVCAASGESEGSGLHMPDDMVGACFRVDRLALMQWKVPPDCVSSNYRFNSGSGPLVSLLFLCAHITLVCLELEGNLQQPATPDPMPHARTAELTPCGSTAWEKLGCG